MPRVESELRSRDLEQMLAEMTITEEPAPVGVGTALTQLAAAADRLVLVERLEVTGALVVSRYYAVPVNRLINSLFGEGLASWVSSPAGGHTLEVEAASSSELLLVLARTVQVLRLILTGSAGAAISTLTQVVPVSAGGQDVSAEVWVRVESLTGSPLLRLRVRALDASGTELDTSTGSEQAVATSGWVLLQDLNFASPSGVGHQLTVTWSTPDPGTQPITLYSVRHRVVGTTPWTTRIGVTGLSYIITRLTASTLYEVQVQAVNSVGEGAWSPSAQLRTGS